MKIPLSRRLQACCGFIPKGSRVADIGTDHGYLGIWLLHNGIARSVIASDVVPGPLSAARKNARRFGTSDRMEFYLSDGAQSIPRDFDALVCAGMGADTMISILEAAPWLRDEKYRLILQCQSKTPMLRKYLSAQGYRIYEETVVRDGRFLYTVMCVGYLPGEKLTPGQCYFPPALLKNPSAELPAYYESVLFRLRRALQGQNASPDPTLQAALQELEALSLDFLKEDTHDNS